MTPERFQQIGEIYDQAVELEPERRSVFLDEMCVDDEELRHEVEALLAAHKSAAGFIEQPAVELAADLFVQKTINIMDGKKIGSYQVLSLIGKGGMGEVYLARDLKLGRKVALKVLPDQFIQDVVRVKMFAREARTASALNHPNIITIFDIGQVDGTHFIATEYIEGQTVRLRLRASEMPMPEIIETAIQTANALAAAHEVGVVHRDIKPENVMIRYDGYIKVLDFGLAKLNEASTTNHGDLPSETKRTVYTLPGAVMGTASYMSPEQIRGETVDGRSDIFSLGVLIYEMAAGKTPFTGATAIEILAATLEREPLPLTQVNRQIPAELERIVAGALRKDREKRYQTMRDLLLDLESLKQQLALKNGGLVPGRPSGNNTVLLRSITGILLFIAILSALFFAKALWPSLAPERATTPKRALTYHLIAERDPKRFPDSRPFRSTGEHIFEAWYQARLMISSDQAGYLYVLNEGPPDKTSNLANYVVLFPDSNTSNWSAAISANHPVQIPQPSEAPDDDWIQWDKERGTEKLWLVWAEHSVPEFEAIKHLANPTEAGAISHPDQIIPIAQYLARHYSNKPEVVKDEEQKQITFKAKGEVLVALVRIEHQ